jgi:hypothetical protein
MAAITTANTVRSTAAARAAMASTVAAIDIRAGTMAAVLSAMVRSNR